MGQALAAIKRRASCIWRIEGFQRGSDTAACLCPARSSGLGTRRCTQSSWCSCSGSLAFWVHSCPQATSSRATGFVQQSFTLLLQRPRIHRFQQIKGKLKLFINIEVIPHLIHITQLTLTNHIQDLFKICVPRLKLPIRITKLSP